MNTKLLTLVALALIGAGCSNGSPEDVTTETSSGNRTTRFADCMRENGVTEFPDPDASGDQAFAEAIERLDPGSATWRKAIAACKNLQPPGLLGAKATPDEMRTRLEFAECMRRNGVKDFPDPVNGEPLVDTNKIPSSATEAGMTAINAAMEQCRGVAAEVLEDR